MSDTSLSNSVCYHCVWNLHTEFLLQAISSLQSVLGAGPTTLLEWDTKVAWIPAFTKPGPLGFSVLACSSLTFTKWKEIQLYPCLITPLMLLLQWKSIKNRIIITPALQRFPEQNKGDTKTTDVQEINLFSVCKDSPCQIPLRLDAARINWPPVADLLP